MVGWRTGAAGFGGFGLFSFAIAGIPWDGSVTNRPGARFGPRSIRQASQMLCDATHPLFDVSPIDRLGDLGDLDLPNTGIEAMRKLVYAFYDPNFSFREVIKRYPEAGGEITDCLSGDVNKDFTPLWNKIREFVPLPEDLPYGEPLSAEAATVK